MVIIPFCLGVHSTRGCYSTTWVSVRRMAREVTVCTSADVSWQNMAEDVRTLSKVEIEASVDTNAMVGHPILQEREGIW